MYDLMKADPPAGDPNEAYWAELEQLTTSPRVRYRVRRDAGIAPRSCAVRARRPPEVFTWSRQEIRGRGAREVLWREAETFCLVPQPFGLGGRKVDGQLHGGSVRW